MRGVKKVGFTAGAFDLCHTGHFLMFKEAKEQCDHLIVALQTDPSLDRPSKNKPVMSLEERRILLEGIRYIDEIVEYDTEADLYKMLQNNELGIDVRILSEEYRDVPFTGHDLPLAVYFNSRGHSFSSSSLRNRVFEAEATKRGIDTMVRQDYQTHAAHGEMPVAA